MNPNLKPIPIKELEALGQTKCWDVNSHIDNFPSLVPIKGVINALHQGETLLIKSKLETIVNLICDRCLNSFKQNIKADLEELIWIGDYEVLERQIQENPPIEEIMEYLNPIGNFNPEIWAFEQLSLQMPLVNNCGTACSGFRYATDKKSFPYDSSTPDPRWSGLKKILKK